MTHTDRRRNIDDGLDQVHLLRFVLTVSRVGMSGYLKELLRVTGYSIYVLQEVSDQPLTYVSIGQTGGSVKRF